MPPMFILTFEFVKSALLIWWIERRVCFSWLLSQGFSRSPGVPELRGGLLLLREERHPLPELRRAPPPAQAPVRPGVSSFARGARPGVPPLPLRLQGVQPSRPVHRCWRANTGRESTGVWRSSFFSAAPAPWLQFV